MFGNEQRKAKVLLSLADVCVTTVAFETAYRIRQSIPLERPFYWSVEVKALLLWFCVSTWVAMGYWLNVHGKLDSGQIRIILRDSFRQVGYSGLALISFEYLLRLDLSRVFIALFILLSWFLLVVFRIAARHLIPVVRREFGLTRHVLIVGLGSRAERLGRTLECYENQGLRILGFLTCAEQQSILSRFQLRHEYPVFPIDRLPLILRKLVVDEVLFAVESDSVPSLDEMLLWCEKEGVRSRLAVDFFPNINSVVALERLGSIPLLTLSGAPDDQLLLLIKRVTDIVVSSAAMIFLSPFLLIIALLVKLTSPGPVIFKQVRCGLNGRKFTCYKFRSMIADAETRLQTIAHLNPKEIITKIPNDPRLTRVGKWLRKFSIDELPQLYNVLRGEMSLVGPRPALPSEVAQYESWQRRRLRMRPGLTCIWAVQGRDKLDFDSWMRLDIQYIDTWSLSLDAKIILMTIPHVISGKGAS